MDAGIIAAFKRGYRRRHLQKVVDGLRALVESPSAVRIRLDAAETADAALVVDPTFIADGA